MDCNHNLPTPSLPRHKQSPLPHTNHSNSLPTSRINNRPRHILQSRCRTIRRNGRLFGVATTAILAAVFMDTHEYDDKDNRRRQHNPSLLDWRRASLSSRRSRDRVLQRDRSGFDRPCPLIALYVLFLFLCFAPEEVPLYSRHFSGLEEAAAEIDRQHNRILS